jgi:CheY-like chemotaxis protein
MALRDAADEAGASAFLTKPIEPLQLVSTVRDLIGTSALTGSVGPRALDDATRT